MRYYLTTMTLLVCLLPFASVNAQSDDYGLVSYYDDSFQGSKTASGELYDKNKYTGAHKKLPFGTTVKVTRLDTKESVKIRINDRGPYIKGRIIEISRKAAEKIGLVKDGVTRVKIEVLGSGVVPDDFETASASSTSTPPRDVKVVPSTNTKPTRSNDDKLVTSVKVIPKKAQATTPPPPKETPKAAEQVDKPVATATPVESPPAAKPLPVNETARRVRGTDFKMYDLYKVQILRPERTGYGVQVASLTNYAGVMKQVAELQEKWFNNVLISVERGSGTEPVYKILLGPFPDRATAKSYEKELKAKKKIDGFIVELENIKY